MQFHKYQAIGNDYLVLNAKEFPLPSPEQIQLLCHRNFGIGSDGILYGPLPSSSANFALRIFNPDASEAEKSGNGLRIFARYLFDQNLVSTQPFTLETPAGIAHCQVFDSGNTVQIHMGQATFLDASAPLSINNTPYPYHPVSVGNPHCVLFLDHISPEIAKSLGPQVENHPNFPNRTNVQFAKIIDKNTIQIEIYERGAGYTLGSGTSACATAAIAHKLNLSNNTVNVVMPGGSLKIDISPDFQLTMNGPVSPIATILPLKAKS